MRKIISLCIAISIAVVIVSFGILAYNAPDAKISMQVSITNESLVGFSADTDAVYFGTLPTNSTAMRKITIPNDEAYAQKVELAIEGGLASWVTLSDNNFVLEPHARRELLIKVVPPGGASSGSYSSVLYVYLKRVWF